MGGTPPYPPDSISFVPLRDPQNTPKLDLYSIPLYKGGIWGGQNGGHFGGHFGGVRGGSKMALFGGVPKPRFSGPPGPPPGGAPRGTPQGPPPGGSWGGHFGGSFWGVISDPYKVGCIPHRHRDHMHAVMLRCIAWSFTLTSTMNADDVAMHCMVIHTNIHDECR